MGWLPHITVSLVTVYAGFYLGIVFLSLSIGGWYQRTLPRAPLGRRGATTCPPDAAPAAKSQPASQIRRGRSDAACNVSQGRAFGRSRRPPEAPCPHRLPPAACGLYYIAELIEEYTITTKRLLGYAIKARCRGWRGQQCAVAAARAGWWRSALRRLKQPLQTPARDRPRFL